MDNAFLELANKIKEKDINKTVFIGIVKTTNPLIITMNGIELEQSDLLFNSNLVGSIDYFSVNDKVLIIASEDKQDLILICKVV